VRIYLDTAPVVFHVERVAGICDRVRARLRRAIELGDTFVVSDLTRFECRVRPLKNGDGATLAAFERFFAGREIVLEAVPRAAWDQAAEIRARHGLRTPDALHVATAVTLGCELLLTSDERIARCPAVKSELIPVIAPD
jgi:predicted nucleic acid-binding protein